MMVILLAGNSIISKEHLRQVIEENGLQGEIVTGASESEALEIAARLPVSIALAHGELLHPGDGSRVLHRVKTDNPGVYTILITGSDISGSPDPLPHSHIDDYIIKPLTRWELGIRFQKAFYIAEKRLTEKTEAALYRIDDFYHSGSALPDNPDPGRLPVTENRSDGAVQYLPRRAAKRTSPISATVAVLGKIFFGAMLLVMAALAFFLVQSSFSGGVPSVAGYQMYIVLSGSMSPAFDTGSLAFVKEADPAKIVPGDIITYRGPGSGGTLTTHRVVDIKTGNGLEFITRGDANNINDPSPVPAGNIVGKVYGSVPYLGYLMGFAQTRQGLIFMVFIPGAFVIFYELRNIYKYMGEMEKHQQKTGGRRRKGKS